MQQSGQLIVPSVVTFHSHHIDPVEVGSLGQASLI